MKNVGQPYSLHFLGHKLPSIKACGSPSPCLTIYKEKWKKNPYPPRIPNIYQFYKVYKGVFMSATSKAQLRVGGQVR